MSTLLTRLVLGLVLPERCAACDRLLEHHERGFCELCAVSLLPLAAACLRCGNPLGSEAQRGCGHCDARWPIDRTWAAWELGGAAQDAIHRFKYGGRADLARALAQAFVPGEVHWDLVVPVPLHRSRLRARRYNQSALLARRVGRTLGRPVAYRALSRVRSTPPQASMSAAQRQQNVRHAFRAARPKTLAGRRVLLVDDVVTTGATALECARVLRSAGAEGVGLWSIARVV